MKGEISVPLETDQVLRNLALYRKNHLAHRHSSTGVSTVQGVANKLQMALHTEKPAVQGVANKLQMALHTETPATQGVANKLQMALHTETPATQGVANKLQMALHTQTPLVRAEQVSFQQVAATAMTGATTGMELAFLNGARIMANIDALIDAHHGGSGLVTANRKAALFEALNAIQGTAIPFARQGILMDFHSAKLAGYLVEEGMMDASDTDNDAHLFSAGEQRLIRANVDKALRLIRLLDPNLHTLINELIGVFPCFRKPGFGGGSVSSLVGMIWLNPQPNWTVIDYADAIVHEFIHNNLFLEDMVHTIFPDTGLLLREDALVTSTILKRKRPLDKAFHSAAVAIGLMYFYQLLSNYEKAISFTESLRQTVTELNGKIAEYLSPAGEAIVQGMNAFLNSFDYEAIAESLVLPARQ